MTQSNVERVVALGEPDEVIGAALEAVPLAMVLTDPNQDDNPISYVNQAFEGITLYSRSFAVGRNCRFLQGEQTDPKDVTRLREGIEAREDVAIDILNYKADGTPFMNRLLVSPIRDESGTVIAHLGVQRELGEKDRGRDVSSRSALVRPIEDTMLAEVQHRVKNHLAMLVGMIRMQASKEVSRKSFEALSHRVRSLALLYDELSGSGFAARSDDTVPAGAYLSRIAASLTTIDGRGSIRVNVECEEMDLPIDLAARLGLVVTEFVTNALEHAFEDRGRGVVRIRFQRLTRGGVRVAVEDDGRGLPEGLDWPVMPDDADLSDDRKAFSSGMGSRIVAALVRSMDARLEVRSGPTGTVVILDLPVS